MSETRWEPVPRVDTGEFDTAALMAIPVEGVRKSLRWVLAHMTAETARHAGHADVLREQLDGATGR